MSTLETSIYDQIKTYSLMAIPVLVILYVIYIKISQYFFLNKIGNFLFDP
jgi:hypothetical protein